MRLLSALSALLVAITAPVVSSAADVPVSAGEVRSSTVEAGEVRRALYGEVHAKEPRSGDFVNVTLFGGLPSSQTTMYVLPSGGSQFRGEIVSQDAIYEGRPKPKTQRADFSISPEASRRIASILENQMLWAERNGRSGGCTDQPIAVLEIVWKGKRRAAVRVACAPPDLTGSLIDTALYQAHKP
ncbi:MAG TPA: hypothetical protein VGG92_12540 [Caulobacteraceae bacterium]|jgi:hypothetical protein